MPVIPVIERHLCMTLDGKPFYEERIVLKDPEEDWLYFLLHAPSPPPCGTTSPGSSAEPGTSSTS